MLDRLVKIFTSLRLTVILLALGLVLVFWGTIAQVQLGLYKAQNEFFRSFIVYWQPAGAHWRLPVFPGGYLVGGLLLLNLFAAHLKYYKPEKRKIGIIMVHLGIVLLLLGQFLTDVLSNESVMHIREGSSANYSEAGRSYELAIIDKTDAQFDTVVTIPGHRLAKLGETRAPELPFLVRATQYFDNSELSRKAVEGLAATGASIGAGKELWWRRLPHETETDRRDIPSGLIELAPPQGSIGSVLVSGYLEAQEFSYNGRKYEITLRPARFYKPFSLSLLEFRFDRYPGTQIPKNFSSRVQLDRPDTGEKREVLIYMNSPLRYNGETFYQADWDKEDEKGTYLQVVHNPSWLTPYFACVLVAAGLVYQFLSHLVKFATKRKAA